MYFTYTSAGQWLYTKCLADIYQAGTWYENIYPGVRCDVPAHVYQSTFEPNTQWSEKFAQGAEIRDYWQDVAKKHDVYQHTKLKHEVLEADWDLKYSVWRVKVKNLNTGEVFNDKFDFVLTAIGRFNDWQMPKIPGIDEYKGHLRHASNWDPSFDPKDKRIAVIGNGASGLQLVPSLQPVASRLDHYARSKTWISQSWAGDERTIEPQRYSQEELDSFKDPATYTKFRKGLEDKYWRQAPGMFKGSDPNEKARKNFTEGMVQRVAKKPELANDIIPDFSPGCRRLTPAPGYLESLCEDNVDYIKTPIARFTATGIETVDGTHREVDAIFCCTGANISMAPPFSIRANGIDLKDAWQADGLYGGPYTYLGLAAPKFPNLLFIMGPNAAGASGTVPYSTETMVTHFAKVLRKASMEGIRSMAPSERATKEFTDYADAFFATTVLSDNCSSWYNGGRPGGRVHGLFPGSSVHVTVVRQDPRWEDWEYEYLGDGENRFRWFFGNGRSKREADTEYDITQYLGQGEVDLKSLHEKWWQVP